MNFDPAVRYSLTDAECLQGQVLSEWKRLCPKEKKQKYDKYFWQEVLPIIEVAKIVGAKDVSFTGANTKNSFDGILYFNNDLEQKIECTSSIDMHLYALKSEYLEQHGHTFTTPKTKAKDFVYEKEIVNNKKTIKRFKQRDELIKADKIDSGNFLTKDMKIIKEKLNCKGRYLDFWLILTTRHNGIEYCLKNYERHISDFWNNQINNPFNAIFILDDGDTSTEFKQLYVQTTKTKTVKI